MDPSDPKIKTKYYLQREWDTYPKFSSLPTQMRIVLMMSFWGNNGEMAVTRDSWHYSLMAWLTWTGTFCILSLGGLINFFWGHGNRLTEAPGGNPSVTPPRVMFLTLQCHKLSNKIRQSISARIVRYNAWAVDKHLKEFNKSLTYPYLKFNWIFIRATRAQRLWLSLSPLKGSEEAIRRMSQVQHGL